MYMLLCQHGFSHQGPSCPFCDWVRFRAKTVRFWIHQRSAKTSHMILLFMISYLDAKQLYKQNQSRRVSQP